MAKKLEEHIMKRSLNSQNRILQNAQTMLNDCLSEDVHLAEKAKGQKTIKLTLDELQDQVHKNRD